MVTSACHYVGGGPLTTRLYPLFSILHCLATNIVLVQIPLYGPIVRSFVFHVQSTRRRRFSARRLPKASFTLLWDSVPEAQAGTRMFALLNVEQIFGHIKFSGRSIKLLYWWLVCQSYASSTNYTCMTAGKWNKAVTLKRYQYASSKSFC